MKQSRTRSLARSLCQPSRNRTLTLTNVGDLRRTTKMPSSRRVTPPTVKSQERGGHRLVVLGVQEPRTRFRHSAMSFPKLAQKVLCVGGKVAFICNNIKNICLALSSAPNVWEAGDLHRRRGCSAWATEHVCI